MSRALFEQGHAGVVSAIVFSSDGSRIATSSKSVGDVRIWDSSGRLIDVLERGADAAIFAGSALFVARSKEIARIENGREV
jgi:WD40 repeat protein